ncbi:2674_t:CDS:10 [Cetraspora pellucida]|uniref:valine--tRNA ligase n=1 Tax=Cetraspora pellucida TaxID=1433469 RepID=A0A9N9GD96_9GLOM|nr:2674_t:CDS:10 [Cetraspora pellucida]
MDENLGKPTKNFTMLAPPPNITGNLHIGHALTLSIQDAIVRWYRMSGYRVSWIPGTDHAGIGTQSVVERQLYKKKKLTRHDLGRENFINEVWKWRELHGNRIIEQMVKLPLWNLYHWKNLFFTMDSPRSHAVTNAFVKLFNDGMIYRDTRLVNWCCALGTAISDIEVDYETVPKRTFLKVPGHQESVEFGVLHKFAYPIADTSSGISELVVATTRIETMLGDCAVAIHPDDPRYKSLHGKKVIHPLLNKWMPIVCDAELVDMQFATGVVKVTPGHDINDYACARRHQLQIVNILNKDGTLNENCGIADLINKDRFEVRKDIINRLQSLGYYRDKDVNHEMRIAKCSRSGDIIEPMLQPQWYIKCKDMQLRALQDVKNGKMQIQPSYHVEEWNRWLGDCFSQNDWCISRQLWWGHPIPAYNLTYEKQKSDEGLWFAATSLFEAEQFVKNYFQQNNIPLQINYTLRQDEDVLDTWFSSALLPLSSLNWKGDQNIPEVYPTTMIETGFDILFFWIARMVMLCTYFSGKPPFERILLHAMVRDAQGRKMSKSLGNVIDPLNVIEGVTLEEMHQTIHNSSLSKSEIEKSIKLLTREFPEGIKACGTDSLRFGLINYTQQTRQINLNISYITSVLHFCNKLWNLFKFSNDRFSSLNYTTHITETVSCDSLIEVKNYLTLVDKYILSRLSDTVTKCQLGFEKFELFEVTKVVKDFMVEDLCGIYLEFIKPILYENSENIDTKKVQKTTLKVLETCLDTSLRLLHPFMPFLTEELWQSLVERCDNSIRLGSPDSIMMSRYPKVADFENQKNHIVEGDMKMVLSVIHAARSLRQSNNIPLGQPLPFIIWSDDRGLLDEQGPIKKYFQDIKKFIKASEIRMIDDKLQKESMETLIKDSAVTLISTNLKVYVPMSSILEIQKSTDVNNKSKASSNDPSGIFRTENLSKLTKKYEKIANEIENLQGRITKAEYLKKVPEKIKENDRKKLMVLIEQKIDLERNIKLAQSMDEYTRN